MTSPAAPTWPGSLSERETEVAVRLARGYRVEEIAAELGVSVKTAALVRFAIRTSLVSGAADSDAPGCTVRDTVRRRALLARSERAS